MSEKIQTKIRKFFITNPCDEAEALCDVIFHPDYDNLEIPLEWHLYYPYKFFQKLDELNRKFDEIQDPYRFYIFLIILFVPFISFKFVAHLIGSPIFDFTSYVSFVLSGLFRISYFRSFLK